MPSEEYLDPPSQETQFAVWLKPDAGIDIPVDRVCEQLLTEFPGAVITAQNSFAAKRLSLELFRQYSQERLLHGTLEPWSWKTMDELNEGVDSMIAENRRAELRSGPKKDLTIPLSNGTQLVGHVGAKSILFLGKCQPSDITVAKLVRHLDSLNIGKAEILERRSEPPPQEN